MTHTKMAPVSRDCGPPACGGATRRSAARYARSARLRAPAARTAPAAPVFFLFCPTVKKLPFFAWANAQFSTFSNGKLPQKAKHRGREAAEPQPPAPRAENVNGTMSPQTLSEAHVYFTLLYFPHRLGSASLLRA